MRLIILFFILLIFLIGNILSGCENQQGIESQKEILDEVLEPYICSTDVDCQIKDIGNCCGYYPRCVNKDYVPDLKKVGEECKEKGLVSVCGYPEISGCTCEKNTCVSMQGENLV